MFDKGLIAMAVCATIICSTVVVITQHPIAVAATVLVCLPGLFGTIQLFLSARPSRHTGYPAQLKWWQQ